MYKLCLNTPKGLVFQTLRFKTRFANNTGRTAYEDDYVETPQYPSIDYETRYYTDSVLKKRNEVLDWQAGIRAKETVEEKLMEMNDIRNYGWKAYHLTEDSFNYDVLPFMKYITRTCSLPIESAPSIYSLPELLSKTKHYTQLLRKPFEEVVKFEMYGVERNKSVEETPAQFTLERNQAIANQVSRFILHALGANEPLLNEVQVDYRPKSEAFWFVGGFKKGPAALRKIEELRKEGTKDPNWLNEISCKDHTFQYLGSPLVQIRSQAPLDTFFRDDSGIPAPELNSDLFLECSESPTQYGYHRGLRYATNIPGHWSGDPAKSNVLSFHSAHFVESSCSEGSPAEFDLAKSPAYLQRIPELLQAQSILTSFTRLLAQAYMLGFDQFGDIDFPLASQTVVFNGIDWSFSSYQLNTIQLDDLRIKKNLKQNYLWTLPNMKLFEENGALNQNVLEILLKFFLAPTFSKQQKFKMPYVKCNLEEVSDDYRREFVLYNFHEMYSQRRQDHYYMQIPEIYNWEKIYKIDHETRPMDARKRFYMQPGNIPYKYKYTYKNPRYRPKRLHFLEGELAKKKHERALQAIKDSQANAFKITDNE